MAKTSLLYALRVLVTALLLFLIFCNIHPKEMLKAVTATSPGYILIALLAQLACLTVAAYRWQLIVNRLGFKAPFAFYLGSYFKGAFFNQGLPTSIGGDGVRIYDCAKITNSTEDAFFGVFIDRIIGLAGLLLLNIAALLLNRTLLPAKVYIPLLTILIGLTSGLLLLFFLRKFSFFSVGKYLGFLGRLSERYFQVYSSLPALTSQLGLSILIHLFSMGTFFLLGQGVGLNFSAQVYLVMVPPVILLTLLPISLAGWGLREGAMVAFFLLIGAERSQVLTLSLLYGFVAVIASLPGLIIWLRRKKTS
ncbi:MAG: lysylphosphatidylglycerol synthase transmembrane domain-containing protein [Candidatus Electrothrix sp. GW3-4]|uniref:lysylphosphatidylglycerol synthase transmembrane domain-containing protein n=1 Tax=Candidatus Electrothrix sp. GW3-4 TaxID=3126740 RepID=UPI0030D0B014